MAGYSVPLTRSSTRLENAMIVAESATAPDPREAEVCVAGDRRAVGENDRTQGGDEDRGREAHIYLQRAAVIVPAKRIRGGDDRHERRRPRSGHDPDGQCPVAESRDGESDRDDEPDHRLDRRQRSLADEVHLPVVHPERGLERAGQHHGDQDQPRRHQIPVAVDDCHHGQGGGDRHHRRHRDQQLEREGSLEGQLLVGLVLLDVLVADTRPA